MKTPLYFVTSNEKKFEEASRILSARGIEVRMQGAELVEIQSDELEVIAAEKAKSAHASLKNDVLVEDDGLFIHSLKGFPGPYSAFVYRTVGNAGVLRLMQGIGDRKATFVSVTAYCGSSGEPQTFVGRVDGRISETLRGSSWGYDPIFMPDPFDLTYAELGPKKDEVSHRKMALERFAEWYAKFCNK